MTETSNLETPFPRPLSGAAVIAPPPALVPPRTALLGNYVELQPQHAGKHAADLYRASHGNEDALRIWDYLPSGPWPSEAAYHNVIRDQVATFDRIYYALKKEGEDVWSGQASLMDIHPQNGVIEIGYIWFGLSLQRTRAATEALYLLMRHAMDDLGYRRMQWRCNALNQKSRAAARRLGFRYEGTFYNHLIFKGKNRDTAWYSILDDEWPEVREIMEQWLAPENFDDQGVAKTSLAKGMTERSPSQRPTE